MHRYHGNRNLHFITCSCYRRQPHLGTARRRDLFLALLEETRRKYRFVVHGYVLMPEHFHLLITEPEVGDPSVVMKVIKQRLARQVKRKGKRTSSAQRWLWDTTPVSVWQKRFYDFNVWSERKRIEKLRYMHRNPVKRGLGGATGTLEVEQLSGVLLWRTRSGAGKLSGVASGDQRAPAQQVWGRERAQSPTHSHKTRMSGAPGQLCLSG